MFSSYFQFRMMDKSTNSIILSGIHHRQNTLHSSIFSFFVYGRHSPRCTLVSYMPALHWSLSPNSNAHFLHSARPPCQQLCTRRVLCGLCTVLTTSKFVSAVFYKWIAHSVFILASSRCCYIFVSVSARL